MYAFGWLLLEIVTGKDIIRRGRSTGVDSVVGLVDGCPRSVAALISSCLETQPSLRPTAQHATKVIERCLMEDHADG